MINMVLFGLICFAIGGVCGIVLMALIVGGNRN